MATGYYIRASDFKSMCKPSAPWFAFIVPWLVAMAGQILALCGIIVPVYSTFYLVVIGNILTILFFGIFSQILFPQKLALNRNVIDHISLSRRFKKITYWMIAFYLAIQLFQMIYFKGFPLLWLITKDPRTYANFGIQSLNGLLNAIYLLSITGLFVFYLKEKARKNLHLLGILFLIPILTVTRQVLISAAIQISCCYLIYNPRKALKIFIWGCVLLGVFIVVGNFRTGLGSLISILQPKPYIPEFLYPLLWIYAYIVTPFNNINAAFDVVNPVGLPINELFALIPTIIRPEIGSEVDTGFKLVHQNMNVSTFYLAPLLDYGRTYSFLLMGTFQAFLISSYRKAIRTKSPIHLIEYSVLYMICILSIFSNLLFFLPVIFQLVIINLAKIKLKTEKTHTVLSIGKI